MSENTPTFFKLKGRKVRVDSEGLVCLNDIHRAGGFTVNQSPSQWARLTSTTKLVAYTLEQTMGKSHSMAKIRTSSVLYTKDGKTGGTWAHPNLALAYAKYLSPALHYEVNEVYLRFKAGDASLADETLLRSTPEGNEWVARRAMSRVVRNEYTDQLHKRGVEQGFKYGNCTNETYRGLFDQTAKELRQSRGLPEKGGNLRDKMTMKELAFVAASEALSVEHMEEVDARGYRECRSVTALSSQSIRSAIETDRRNRQKRLG